MTDKPGPESALTGSPGVPGPIKALSGSPSNGAGAAATPAAASIDVPGTSLTDFEDTLRRLVDRIARILQAERCVFLLHDPVAGTLYPTQPSLGFTDDQLLSLERPVSAEGVSGEVFRTNTPIIVADAATDPRALAEGLPLLGIRNGLSVPLVVEKRDELSRVLDRSIVGVVHVFDKTFGVGFGDEDRRLLLRMAIMAAAIISSAEVYREVAQETQELFHAVDSLFAGLVMVGQNGRMLQVNASARAILGINPSVPLVGIPYVRAVTDDRVRALIERALQPGAGEVVDEITIEAQAGRPTHVYQVQCAPIRDGQGGANGVVAIFNDITQIRAVDRMKDDFLSMVSHELKTPLTAIKGFTTELLQDQAGYYGEDQRREFYQIIDAECDRLTRLIKDLLDISQIELGAEIPIHVSEIDLPALAGKILAARRVYARDYDLKVDFPPGFPPIEVDCDKMEQVLTNLVDNAIKYSPNGGTVTISGRVVDERGQFFVMKVTDHGIGVPREHLQRVFDRFYRVDNRDNRDIGGTGIGLALVKALIEAHHGFVTMDSEVGRGSTVTVTLPRRQPDNVLRVLPGIDWDSGRPPSARTY
jgi:two-component system phosphate regulon sensor histidine kinase PhoR